MEKSKKLVLFVLVLCLALGTLWFYWEWPMSMDTLIPEESWVRAELRHGTAAGEAQDVEYIEPALDRILPQMNAVRLTRAEKRAHLDDQYFQILLYKGEAYPTVICVGSTGRVRIAQEMDFDHWKHYEGGEDFYRYLQSYSQTLDAVYNIAQ